MKKTFESVKVEIAKNGGRTTTTIYHDEDGNVHHSTKAYDWQGERVIYFNKKGQVREMPTRMMYFDRNGSIRIEKSYLPGGIIEIRAYPRKLKNQNNGYYYESMGYVLGQIPGLTNNEKRGDNPKRTMLPRHLRPGYNPWLRKGIPSV